MKIIVHRLLPCLLHGAFVRHQHNWTMEQRLTIVTLGVSDITTSTSFYEQTFGWDKTKDSNEKITFFKLGGILLSLYPKADLAEDAGVEDTKIPENGFRGFTMAHVCRSKAEVDGVFAKLKAAQGGNKHKIVVKEPKEAFWGGYSGYVADPDGNLWEVAHNPFLKMTEDGAVA